MDLLARNDVWKDGGKGGSEDYGIVVFSHLRWKFVWQRPQQFMSRFAGTHPILFVELTDFDLEKGAAPKLELENVAPNVTVANIHMAVDMQGSPEVDRVMRQHCKLAMAALNSQGHFDSPLLWFYSPMDVAWTLGHLPSRGVVYDCMDELSQFKGAPPELLERERMLMKSADVVFTGGYELWLKKSKQHANVHFFGCCVEFDHFNQAQDETKPIPADMEGLDKPVIGWFGVVDERVDYKLLEKVAKLRPQYEFVLVGPVVKVDPNDLPKVENLKWLGGRDYRVLPDYCRAFDACMMCFALNEATEYINPTKALEYLATGKPVISTPVSDVVRQYSDTVLIGKTAAEFAQICDTAILKPDKVMVEKGLKKAEAASWEATVDKMQSIIAEAVEVRQKAYLS